MCVSVLGLELGVFVTYRVPQHVEILQRMQHVARRHGRRGSDLLD